MAKKDTIDVVRRVKKDYVIMREVGEGFVSPERYKLVCPECGRLWTDDHWGADDELVCHA